MQVPVAHHSLLHRTREEVFLNVIRGGGIGTRQLRKYVSLEDRTNGITKRGSHINVILYI